MIGRTPSYIQAIRPLRNGVIADFDITEKMLRYFIQKVHRRRWARPRIVICVPSGITGVERRAVEEAAYHAGARKAYTIEEPMAAAIGAMLPVHEPAGSMVVDVGGGTTEVAVISLGGIVTSRSIRMGGDELDEAIINWVKKEYNVMLGERTAEQVKMAIGSAWPHTDEPAAEVRGRDLVSRAPQDDHPVEPRAAGGHRGTAAGRSRCREIHPRQDPARTRGRYHGARYRGYRRGAHYCAGWASAWPTRRGCRSSSLIDRCNRSLLAQVSAWRSSTFSRVCWSLPAAPNPRRPSWAAPSSQC